MSASTPDTQPASPYPWWTLAALLLLTLGVRGGTLWALRDNLNADPDAYRQIAAALRKTGVYTLDLPEGAGVSETAVAPTAFRPPLYPLLLASVATDNNVTRPAVAGLHLLLGLATVAGVFHLGRLWQLGPAATIAAMLVACDPILLQQSTVVMTETLATFLAIVCLWLLTRYHHSGSLRDVALAGASIGLATLCRPTFLPWLALICVVIWMRSGTFSERVRRVAIVPLMALLALLPWALRNQVALRHPILTTTNGGFALWVANNDDFYDYLRSDKQMAWQAESDEASSVRVVPASKTDFYEHPEILRSRAESQAAWETIRRRPAMFAYACLVRMGYLWSPLPQKTQISESTYRVLARYLVALWYVGVYGMAILGAFHMRGQLLRPPWVWGITLCLTFTALHAVYWSNLRMRAPLMPVVALLAAAGCSAAISRPAPTLRR